MANELPWYGISLYDKVRKTVIKRYGRPFYDRKVGPGHAFLPTKYTIHGMGDDLLHTKHGRRSICAKSDHRRSDILRYTWFLGVFGKQKVHWGLEARTAYTYFAHVRPISMKTVWPRNCRRYGISLHDKVCKRYGRPFYDRKVRPGHAFLPKKYSTHGMGDDLLHTKHGRRSICAKSDHCRSDILRSTCF